MIPGGFSYGDYLRAGRDRALLAGDGGGRRVRAGRAGPVLGICNGFQVLCEAGLLPGALLPNDVAAVRLPPGRRERRAHRHSLHAAPARPASVLSIPVKHTTGRWFAPPDARRSSRRTARSCCATRPGTNPNGSLADIAGVANEQGNVFGLMPHPEHAVDALTGSDRRRCSCSARSPAPVAAVAGVTVGRARRRRRPQRSA